MQFLWQDLKYACRQLVRRRLYVCLVVLTLGFGIGANSAVFSVLNAVLLRPLPYPAADRLVTVWSTYQDWKRFDVLGSVSISAGGSLSNFVDWREQSSVFEEMAAYSQAEGNQATLHGPQGPRRLTAMKVTASFFPILGIQPRIGNFFSPEMERSGNSQVAVLSHSLWQDSFGGSPSIIGTSIRLNEQTFEVIGVAPAGFKFLEHQPDFWAPVVFREHASPRERASRSYSVIGRLRPGVTISQAQNEMDAISQHLREAYPDTNRGSGVRLEYLHEHLTGNVKSELLLLFLAALVLFLIGALNLVGLVSSNYLSRIREFSIRMSLGAARRRLVQQLLTESLLLALLSVGFGILIAGGTLSLIHPLLPANLPRQEGIGLDVSVCAFAVLISILSVCLFGLIPSFGVTRSLGMNQVLHGTPNAYNQTDPVARRVVRLIVVGQIATALTLLISANLFVTSYLRLVRVEPGFDEENLLTFRILAFSRNRRLTSDYVTFYSELFAHLENLPFVRSVASTTSPPFTDFLSISSFRFGPEESSSPEELVVEQSVISPSYFQTMGIPMLQGRSFDPRDGWDSPKVIVINETMARRYWPSENPLGRRIWIGKAPVKGSANAPHTIVGVAADVRHRGLMRSAPPRIYYPFSQAGQNPLWNQSLVLRLNSLGLEALPQIRREIAAFDDEAPIYDARMMDDLVAESLGEPRFRAFLVTSFALLALILATAGIFGVMAHETNRSTHEIVVRLTLGAVRLDVFRLLISRGILLIGAGLFFGVLGAIAVSTTISSVLYQVASLDAFSFLSAIFVLGFVALSACLIPAWRSVAFDPASALREE